jgi:ribosomal protein S27AE
MAIQTDKFDVRFNSRECPQCGDDSQHPQAFADDDHVWQCYECSSLFTTAGKIIQD